MEINNCATYLRCQKKQALTREAKLFAICFDFGQVLLRRIGLTNR
jgi:hypothetical protein